MKMAAKRAALPYGWWQGSNLIGFDGRAAQIPELPNRDKKLFWKENKQRRYAPQQPTQEQSWPICSPATGHNLDNLAVKWAYIKWHGINEPLYDHSGAAWWLLLSEQHNLGARNRVSNPAYCTISTCLNSLSNWQQIKVCSQKGGWPPGKNPSWCPDTVGVWCRWGCRKPMCGGRWRTVVPAGQGQRDQDPLCLYVPGGWGQAIKGFDSPKVTVVS